MTDGTGAAPTLAGRVATQSAIAAALIELEGHPAHDLLAASLTGVTAARWATVKVTLAALWQDFAAYQAVVTQACAATDPAEVTALIAGPSIEVGRVVVEDRITGRVEQVERISLDELTERMNTRFDEVRAFLRLCHARHEAYVTRTVPLSERLHAAREHAAALEAEAETIRVGHLSRRVHALSATAAADPLATDDEPFERELAAISAEVDTVAGRLAEAATLRTAWPGELASVTARVTEVEALIGDAMAVHARATEIVTGPVPPLPADPTRELRSRLAAVQKGGWTTRATAMAELRAAADAVAVELAQARDLAAGLIERRAELRGRFEAYRAKAVRVGRAEEPAALTLEEEIRAVLWTKPCDLGAATRAVVAYQRVVGRPS